MSKLNCLGASYARCVFTIVAMVVLLLLLHLPMTLAAWVSNTHERIHPLALVGLPTDIVKHDAHGLCGLDASDLTNATAMLVLRCACYHPGSL